MPTVLIETNGHLTRSEHHTGQAAFHQGPTPYIIARFRTLYLNQQWACADTFDSAGLCLRSSKLITSNCP